MMFDVLFVVNDVQIFDVFFSGEFFQVCMSFEIWKFGVVYDCGCGNFGSFFGFCLMFEWFSFGCVFFVFVNDVVLSVGGLFVVFCIYFD